MKNLDDVNLAIIVIGLLGIGATIGLFFIAREPTVLQAIIGLISTIVTAIGALARGGAVAAAKVAAPPAGGEPSSAKATTETVAKILLILLLPAFFLAMAAGPARAATSNVTLAWDYDNAADPTVVGFKMYRILKDTPPTDAEIRAVVPFVINDKAARTFTDKGVPNGHVWYVVTAFDGGTPSLESASSNMADTVLSAEPKPASALTITTIVTTTVSTTVVMPQPAQ